MKQNMIQGLAPVPRRLNIDFQVIFYLPLARKVLEFGRTKRFLQLQILT